MTVPAAEPKPNPPFARILTWAVVDAERTPPRIANVRVSGRYGTTETQLAEIPESWTLNVLAAVGERTRQETFSVDRNAYDRATTALAFETRGAFYAWLFVSLVGLWMASAVCAWVYLFQPPVIPALAAIAVLLGSPPFVAKAVVRGMWWAGRGLLKEERGRWIIAGALWAFALAPLIELQVIVG